MEDFKSINFQNTYAPWPAIWVLRIWVANCVSENHGRRSGGERWVGRSSSIELELVDSRSGWIPDLAWRLVHGHNSFRVWVHSEFGLRAVRGRGSRRRVAILALPVRNFSFAGHTANPKASPLPPQSSSFEKLVHRHVEVGASSKLFYSISVQT